MVRRSQLSSVSAPLLALALTLAACGEATPGPGEPTGTFQAAISGDPLMHVFPVKGPHNIGYDARSCSTGTCQATCPDANANSDYGGDHHGIDVFAHRGAELVAVVDGTIVRVGTPSATSGLRVRLRDAHGWEYYYGHLDSAAVTEGQQVTAGQLVGTMGNTGTQGVHLHFNISPDGAYSNDINPFALLQSTSPTACAPPAAPPLAATHVGQSATTIEMQSGQSVEAWLEYRNDGALAWDETTRIGTSGPRDRESTLAGPEWLGPNRPTSVDATTAPGQVGRFTFTFVAPAVTEPTTFVEHLGLLQEGVAWFGPAEDALSFTITVTPAADPGPGPGPTPDPDPAPGPDPIPDPAPAPAPGPDGGPGPAPAPLPDPAPTPEPAPAGPGSDSTPPTGDVSGGCSTAPAGSPASGPAGALLLLIVALLAGRAGRARR